MSKKNLPSQKESSKGATITPALELNVDADLRRLCESCIGFGEYILPFSRRVRVELQRVREGDQPNVPFIPFFAHGSIPLGEVRTLFTNIFPNYPLLRVIQLYHCSLGDEGILVIVNFVRTYRPSTAKNPFGIQCIEVPGCQIGPVGAKHIGTLFMESETLNCCVLDFNPLGDAGAKAIATTLQWNGTLKDLSLQHCAIGAAGAEALAEGALKCSNIRALSLRGNHLGPEGVKHVGTALGVSTTIESIDIADTRFGHSCDAVEALCQGIGKCTSLTSVDMDYNVLNPDAASLVTAVLVENKRLTEFRVHERMDSDLYLMIQHALERNGRALRKSKKRTKS
uniref:Uncharacterized protein TCIL3000_11_13990 n=1 Tax=Trypanosoma congolense (strain IL3000) TaxID=1068625 RepID=G0V2M1_TRYCI|nr:unnamed protein product [Trypanosoma congolense IL3000]